MSYCVQCGVELAASEMRCPLCGVPVQNPAAPPDPNAPRPYPPPAESLEEKGSRRYAVVLGSILLGLPAALCLLVNLLLGGRITWSAYVVGALGMLWVCILSPVVLRRAVLPFCIAADSAALALYLLLIYLWSGRGGWYLPLALPLVVLCGALLLLTVEVLVRAKLRLLQKISVVLGGVILLVGGIEVVCDLYSQSTIRLTWSPFVMLPCLAIALLLFEIDHNEAVKEQIRRRLHI